MLLKWQSKPKYDSTLADERSLAGRGRVKTRNYPVFGCRFTLAQVPRSRYRAFWWVDFRTRCRRHAF